MMLNRANTIPAARERTDRQAPSPEARRGKRVYLSVGSNLGDRVANLRKALALLNQAGIEVRRVSSLYKTQPVDFGPQPWFVNCAAEVVTDLMPLRLLQTLKAIERALGVSLPAAVRAQLEGGVGHGP